jgi:hypothetical protein
MSEMSAPDSQGFALERLMVAALEGGREAIEAFYRELFRSTLFVPNRFQAMPLSDSPTYPNEFLDLLGVRDRERVVIPAFTHPELIRDWSGTEFAYREISFVDLAGLAPDGWWVVLNPGSDIEKEFSAWELEQFRSGDQALPILVEEALAHEVEPGLSFCEVAPEFSSVKELLRQFASAESAIQALYLVQRDRQGDGEGLPTLVLGVSTDNIAQAGRDRVRGEIVAVAERALIGSATVQVMLGGALESSMFEVFKGFTPFYQRRDPLTGAFAKVLDWFGRFKQ